jgi:hypothetical protein
MQILDSQTFLTRLGLSMSDITAVGAITWDVMPAFPSPTAFASQFYSPTVAEGTVGAALTIDWNRGQVHTATLSDALVLTFSNPLDGGRYVLALTQDNPGSRTVTWPANVKWSGGSAPTLTTTAGQTDLIGFIYLGTSYYGAAALNY